MNDIVHFLFSSYIGVCFYCHPVELTVVKSVYLMSRENKSIHKIKLDVQRKLGPQVRPKDNPSGPSRKQSDEFVDISLDDVPSYSQSPLARSQLKPKGPYLVNKVKIAVYVGDLLHLNNIDCIVNAANESLNHSGALAGAIRKAAGESFQTESTDYVKTHGKVAAGHVCSTSAGRLRYKRVIHAVGPRWMDFNGNNAKKAEICKRKLASAIENSIIEANRCQMNSVAIPAVGSGKYNSLL